MLQHSLVLSKGLLAPHHLSIVISIWKEMIVYNAEFIKKGRKNMKIKLLGTAAAEGIPAIFCSCETCMKARELGGKDIRTRTSAIIDDQLKIDFPPDTYHHVLMNNLDLANVKHLLFTHTHYDHFYPEELWMRLPGFAHGVTYPMHIYGNDVVMSKSYEILQSVDEQFKLHLIQPFKTFNVEEFSITPLIADHDPLETCLIFYIEKGEKAILYGHDTGWFPQQTWDWLENKKIDVVILDCTHGLLPGRRNHMNVDAVKEIKDIFIKRNIINEQSQVVATHFSHNAKLTHAELESIFKSSQIEVAYDGMVITC